MRRLCHNYDAETPDDLTNEQRQYCGHYHRALVEPFVDNRRWYVLLRNAQQSWGQVFHYFPNLQHIGVGCCERVDHPTGTYTNVFVSQFGRHVTCEAEPPFVEDPTINMAWASALVLEGAPQTVRSLQLSMANMDNFNSFATVNRLLSIVYRNSQFLSLQPPLGVTELSITLRGVDGLHGELEWTGDTGSAGLLRYWKKVLGALRNLRYLEFREEVGDSPNLAFTSGEETDSNDNVVVWLLHHLKHNRLETLRLRDFFLDPDWFRDMFFTDWPNLKNIILDNTSLRWSTEDKGQEEHEQPSEITVRDHHNEKAWMRICQFLSNEYPSVNIHINQPASWGEIGGNYILLSKDVEELQRLPRVKLNVRPSYPFTDNRPPENLVLVHGPASRPPLPSNGPKSEE